MKTETTSLPVSEDFDLQDEKQGLELYRFNCEKHGEYSVYALPGYKYFCRCPACLNEETVRLLRAKARIPARFKDCRFKRFITEGNDAAEIAKNGCKEYAKLLLTESDPQNIGSLILAGNCGTGKTFLACAIANALIDRKKSVRYWTANGIVRAVRSTWNSSSRDCRQPSFSYDADLIEPDLLIIDEVGVQAGSENEQQIIFDVINARYNEMRPVIVISNEDIEGITRFLGPRTFDRLCENGQAIGFSWASYRRQKTR